MALGLLLSGCLARTGNSAERLSAAIADEAMAVSAKLPDMKEAAAVNDALAACAAVITARTRELAALAPRAALRRRIGPAYRRRLLGALKYLTDAVKEAAGRFGQQAVAAGSGKIRSAIAFMSNSL
jgi:alkylhydroperoxidase/carboxymuconolactone decarboxylase family protein YurZ